MCREKELEYRDKSKQLNFLESSGSQLFDARMKKCPFKRIFHLGLNIFYWDFDGWNQASSHQETRSWLTEGKNNSTFWRFQTNKNLMQGPKSRTHQLKPLFLFWSIRFRPSCRKSDLWFLRNMSLDMEANQICQHILNSQTTKVGN